MYDIPIDFSALSVLYCARKYQFSCVRGIDGSSAATDFGNACHAFFEARNKGDTRAVAEIVTPLVSKWNIAAADQTKLMLICITFDQQKNPKPIIDTANNPLAEYKFSWPWATYGNYRIILCGTMDLVYCVDNSFLCVRDYKTCAAMGSTLDKKIAEYVSSLQLDFYAYALHKYLYQFLSDTHADMALRLAITGQYTMVLKSAAPLPKFDSTPFTQITPYTINSVDRILHNLIPKAISIHESATIQPPEGAAYKMCSPCNYYRLCLEKDESNLLNKITKLPVRQYDPTNFR